MLKDPYSCSGSIKTMQDDSGKVIKLFWIECKWNRPIPIFRLARAKADLSQIALLKKYHKISLRSRQYQYFYHDVKMIETELVRLQHVQSGLIVNGASFESHINTLSHLKSASQNVLGRIHAAVIKEWLAPFGSFYS